MTEDDKKVLERQKGELYFMRAYSYWMISRILCLPIMRSIIQNVLFL